jgi:hypothetical protein
MLHNAETGSKLSQPISFIIIDIDHDRRRELLGGIPSRLKAVMLRSKYLDPISDAPPH